VSVTRPYRRTVRPFPGGNYAGGIGYIEHPQYAEEPEHYIRGFNLLVKDLLNLFDYVEPSDTNLKCYSYQIHGLLMRTCIEVEANLTAILRDNGYSKADDWNMGDYRKIEASHRLSSYAVRFPVWQGGAHTRTPYASWSGNSKVPWYQNYNAAKHDRKGEFQKADFETLTDAFAGLAAIICAQFLDRDFSPKPGSLALAGPADGFDETVGEYFRVRLPHNWAPAECYAFEVSLLTTHATPFQNYPYPL